MKTIVKETDQEGLESFLGKRTLLMCGNYFYVGDLVGVSETDAKLDNAAIVYETGELKAAKYTDAQELPSPWYVRLSFVESYGTGK